MGRGWYFRWSMSEKQKNSEEKNKKRRQLFCHRKLFFCYLFKMWNNPCPNRFMMRIDGQENQAEFIPNTPSWIAFNSGVHFGLWYHLAKWAHKATSQRECQENSDFGILLVLACHYWKWHHKPEVSSQTDITNFTNYSHAKWVHKLKRTPLLNAILMIFWVETQCVFRQFASISKSMTRGDDRGDLSGMPTYNFEFSRIAFTMTKYRMDEEGHKSRRRQFSASYHRRNSSASDWFTSLKPCFEPEV